MFSIEFNQEKNGLYLNLSSELRIDLPVNRWLMVDGRALPMEPPVGEASDFTVSFGRGAVRADITFVRDPGTEAVVQRVELEFLKDTSDFLLDVRMVPRMEGRLDWLTVPGLFYGDNNRIADRVDYPKDMGLDWSFRADASPCPGLHFPGQKAGYGVFLPADRVELDQDGKVPAGAENIVGVGWFNGGEGREFRLTFPCQETPYAYHRPDRLDSGRMPRLKAVSGLRIRFEIFHFATEGGRQGYFQPVRRLYEHNRPQSGLAHDPERIEKTAALFAHCMRESHFLPGIGFSHRQDLPEVHSGWSGGFSAVEAGLAYGEAFDDPVIYRQAEEMADFICRTGCSKTGYFNAEFRKGRWRPHVYWGKADGLHIRHASEGCLFLGRILARESVKGRRRPEWREAFYRNLEAVIRDQRPDGSLPIEVDPKTGRVLDWEGTTPGTWAGSLIIGACLAEEEGDGERAGLYRRAAIAAGQYYLERYVLEDRFFGGPYDAYRVPNMEDAYNLLNAYSELYRYTRDPRFLTGARTCAEHLLSWRYAYNVEFPEGTICRDQHVSTYGMAPASVRNRHIQNWDTAAGLALYELSQWTGDSYYAQSALDNLNQSCQLVEQGDGALGIPKGGQSEQWYATEFYWFGSFGNYGKGNLWKVSVVFPKSGFLTAVSLVAEWRRSL